MKVMYCKCGKQDLVPKTAKKQFILTEGDNV